jgi:hypothetical protein
MSYPFKLNKYFTIYQAIISRAKHRQLDGYYEEHHYVPRSLGGTDAAKNLVKLTAREHYICHRILPRIVQDEHVHKMIAALNLMFHNSKLISIMAQEGYKSMTSKVYSRFAQIASPYLKESELINREKRLQAIQDYWKTDEAKLEAEQRSIKMQSYWDNLDDQTFQTRSIENKINGSTAYENLTPDERELHRQQSQAASISFWSTVTDEERAKLGKKSLETKLKNGTDLSASAKRGYANMDPEIKAARAEKIRIAKKEYWAKQRAKKNNTQLLIID